MTNENETDYVHIAARGPRIMRDWLNRHARIKMKDASTIIRELIRNYIRQVDAAAYKEIEAAMAGDDKEGSDGERK